MRLTGFQLPASTYADLLRKTAHGVLMPTSPVTLKTYSTPVLDLRDFEHLFSTRLRITGHKTLDKIAAHWKTRPHTVTVTQDMAA